MGEISIIYVNTNNKTVLKYNYKILKNRKLKINEYFLKSIDENSIEKIRKWRNKQINILRQKNQLSTEDQKIYFPEYQYQLILGHL